MEQSEEIMLLILGGIFVIIGLALILGGRQEEKGYYDSLSGRNDVREFVSHEPERAEPGSLKVGGWISLAIGLVVMAIGGGFLLWG